MVVAKPESADQALTCRNAACGAILGSTLSLYRNSSYLGSMTVISLEDDVQALVDATTAGEGQ